MDALLGIAVLVISILILLVDFELPIELKGFIFYAQVRRLLYTKVWYLLFSHCSGDWTGLQTLHYHPGAREQY